MWLVCAASLLATWFIARSKFGYALVAIRENEDAAAVLGVDATRFKIAAWAVSAMMAGAGPFAGAVLLTAINETLWSRFPQIHTLFFGAVIVLVVLFLPRGLLYLVQQKGGWKRMLGSLRAYRV